MAKPYTRPVKIDDKSLSIRIKKNKETGLLDMVIPKEFFPYLKNTKYNPENEKGYGTLRCAELLANLIRNTVEANYNNSKK